MFCKFSGAEQTFQKFLDLCRQTEAFFLNKRLVLSKQKPEQVIKDVSLNHLLKDLYHVYHYMKKQECVPQYIDAPSALSFSLFSGQ